MVQIIKMNMLIFTAVNKVVMNELMKKNLETNCVLWRHVSECTHKTCLQ